MKNEAVIIEADDWEGLFVNGRLVNEGHTLNEGTSRKKYLEKVCLEYDIMLSEIKDGYVTEEYENKLYDIGSFDEDLSDVGYTINE